MSLKTEFEGYGFSEARGLLQGGRFGAINDFSAQRSNKLHPILAAVQNAVHFNTACI